MRSPRAQRRERSQRTSSGRAGSVCCFQACWFDVARRRRPTRGEVSASYTATGRDPRSPAASSRWISWYSPTNRSSPRCSSSRRGEAREPRGTRQAVIDLRVPVPAAPLLRRRRISTSVGAYTGDMCKERDAGTLGLDSGMTCAVTVGRYELNVGAPPGTLISLAAQPTGADLRPLRLALQDGGDDKKQRKVGVGDLPDAIDDVSGATAEAENAIALLRSLAEGNVLEPKRLSSEIDALLDLVARLDRDEHSREALQVAQALSGLLALTMRWAELVRSPASWFEPGEDRRLARGCVGKRVSSSFGGEGRAALAA
jgi:hypothetical protein